jgi:ATP-dependent Lon protease
LNVETAQNSDFRGARRRETLATADGYFSAAEIAQIQQKLQQDVQSQFSDAQRRAYLREQMKAINAS